MRTFTLDTNCILAIDEARPEALAIRALADAHANQRANVAVVAISASENQQGGRSLETFNQFRDRLEALGLAHLEILPALAEWDVTFFDYCVWSGAELEALEEQIRNTLFPSSKQGWQFYQTSHEPNDELSANRKLRNAKCDVQAMWAHIHYKRNIFVTTDENFHAINKKVALITLGADRIETPEAAAALITT